MKESPIGIFDSGIGGLTIAHSIKEKLPNESIIYFGDTKHLPYGEKSKGSIQKFSEQISRFLISKNCKSIIIACNSASAVAYKQVQELTGNIPVFNVIDPVIKEVIKNPLYSKIGVIGTKATIKSNIYNSKIKNEEISKEVYSLATPLLAPMIEEGFINEKIAEKIIQNYLEDPILEKIDSLILACTHYPLIINEIKKYYNNRIDVIDSADIVSNFVYDKLADLNLLRNSPSPKYNFYVSDYTESFEKSARFFFQEKIKLEQVDIHE